MGGNKGKNKKPKGQTQDPEVVDQDKEQPPKTEEQNHDETPETPTQESLQSESNNNDSKNEEASEDTRTEQSTVNDAQNNDVIEEQKSETPIATNQQPTEEQINEKPEGVEIHAENNDQTENNTTVEPTVEEDQKNEEVSSEPINQVENVPVQINAEETKAEEVQKETEPIQEPETAEQKVFQPEQPEQATAEEVPVTEEKVNANEIEPQAPEFLEKPIEPEVEIKQSTESIQPENLETEEEKVSILKSYHSSEGDQSKIEPEVQQAENVIEIPATTVVDNSKMIVEPEVAQTNKNEHEKNSEILKEIHVVEEKLQSKEVEPIRKSSQPIITPAPFIPEVQPEVKENLQYTNNLPIIEKERTLENQEPKVFKEKENNEEKLNNQVESGSAIKRIAISGVTAALCVGACMYGKADKRISVGISIASFIAAFLVQK